MAAERLSMRKILEVLRLKHELGLSARKIARICSVSRSTAGEYLARFERAGLLWPLEAQVDQAALEALLFPAPPRMRPGTRPRPDFEWVHRELRSHKHVTLQQLWLEYKQAQPLGCQYSQFCDLYRRWRGKLDVVLRQPHRAGEKMFVDWAGQSIPISDRSTGQSRPAWLFVAVLGASNYTYAEAAESQQSPAWLGCHVRALKHFKGCPEIVVPDNAKTAVHSPCRYEPELNPAYAELAAHYGMAVIPARSYKPRDKAKVESGVLVAERWILAALRHRTFFSLAELNQAIGPLLEKLNERPFRKLPGCRRQWFEQLERPALAALPARPYELAEWKKARVNIDYHIELKQHYYSVPCALIGQAVEVRFNERTVEVFHRGVRVASHRRSLQAGQATTLEAHRPRCHRRYLEWTPSRLIRWAAKLGPSTAAVVQAMLASRRHPEQSYRSCLGLLRMAQAFGEGRLEAACARALHFDVCSYRSVKSILANGLDRAPLPESRPESPPLNHDNLRGGSYFDTPEVPSC